VCGSFWRVDKIQNVVTMETEVPKCLITASPRNVLDKLDGRKKEKEE
jgi:hypothetical protein